MNDLDVDKIIIMKEELMTKDGEVTLIYEYLNIIQLLHPCSISLTQFQSPLSLSCGLDALRAEVIIRKRG